MAMKLNDPLSGRRETDVNATWRRRGVLGALILVALLGGEAAVAGQPAPCNMRLSVELTPDVPDPRDVGFLSSLLGDHPDFELSLRRMRHGSVIVLELTGPGPDYRCQDVVEAMRKDGRVLSVRAREEYW
jgi:hypothetical protein